MGIDRSRYRTAAAVAMLSLPAVSVARAAPARKPAPPPATPAGLIAQLKKGDASLKSARLSLLTVRRQGALPDGARGPAAWDAGRSLPTAFQRREYLIFHGRDWKRDMTATDAQGNVGSHVILGLRQGVGRVLQESGHAEQARRSATVGEQPELDASDAVLLGRSAGLLEGITWSSARKQGAQQVLTGKRGDEKVTLTLRTSPRTAIDRFRSEETLVTPQGSVFRSQELIVTYRNGKSGLEPKTVEHLVYAGAPISQVVLTRYSVEGAQLNPTLGPEELTVTIPAGTKVSDQRFQPVLHYTQGDHDLSLAELKALHEKQGDGAVQVGRPAPEWELKGLDGKTSKLADLRGRVVVLTWFASWCGPCRAEAPRMEAEIWRKFRDRGLTVVGINAGEQEDPEKKARGFVTEAGVTYPVVLDVDHDACDAYGIQAFPTIAIIDRKGVLRYLQAGFDEDAVKQKVESLVGDR